METVQVKNKRKPKRKVIIKFDEAERKEFLNGFHKRKLERKKKAKDDELSAFKDEKKRIKLKKKGETDARLKRFEGMFEKVKSVEESKIFDTGDTNVTITEVTDIDLSVTGTRLGANLDLYDEDNEENEEDAPKEKKHRKTVFTHRFDKHFKLKDKRMKKLKKKKNPHQK